MNEIQYLLGQIAQEAGEVTQEAIKCQMFGIYEVYDNTRENPHQLTNGERLEHELQDLLASVRFLNMVSGSKEIETEVQHDKLNVKFAKISTWLSYSKKIGQTTS